LKVQCIHGVDGLTEDEVRRPFTCSQTSSSSEDQSSNLVLGIEKNNLFRIKKHVLGIKKLFTKGFEMTGSWERKKKECTILSPMLG
jgi:hypothetical protein